MTSVISNEDMPVCPYCKTLITEEEPSCIIRAHKALALSHQVCVETYLEAGIVPP